MCGSFTTNHNGLDIAYSYGTPILAVEAGTVIKAGYHVSYGNYLVINHGGGYCTLYAHCSQLLAQVGDKVNKYDTIAKVGATGDVTGNHLHICVIIDGVYVNPKWISALKQRGLFLPNTQEQPSIFFIYPNNTDK